jgi:hypothetical protein
MRPSIETRLFGRSVWTGECLAYSGGSVNRSGHRQIWFRGSMRLAHRVAWTVQIGEVPQGLCVLHRCDNPPCVHIGHLFLGTVSDNNRDRDEKGRGKMPTGDQRGRPRVRPLVHGTLSGYVKKKCRCHVCFTFMSNYRKKG